MSLQSYQFDPSTSIHPDTVAFYPFTFNGNVTNSGQRLQTVANMAGVSIVAAELLGQNTRTIFDLKTSDALQPGPSFESTCKRTAELVLSSLADYPKRVGIGHSLGGAAITGLQRYGEVQPFTTVELCDAFNLRAPQNRLSGYGRFAVYQIADIVQGLRPGHRQPPITTTVESFEATEHENSLLKKIANLSPLMRSTESKAGTIALARMTRLPLHVIGLTHGMAGPDASLQPFLAKLLNERQALAEHQGVPPAALRADRQAGWHSALMDPATVAANLRDTLAMSTTEQ